MAFFGAYPIDLFLMQKPFSDTIWGRGVVSCEKKCFQEGNELKKVVFWVSFRAQPGT